ncbi:MAG: voltage-gated chloride channel protein [Planctomycetota bacterium]|nr:MAG: voltage-gated chloride channel protein [Planctomycetota bacterium]
MLLDGAQANRSNNPWIVLLLPFAGIGIVAFSRWWGGWADAGNAAMMYAAEHPQHHLPRRMAPLILLTTVATHWFGGSAGREGTAVQMGASLASLVQGIRRTWQPQHRQMLLLAGMAAGFSGLFGTPLAATIFALEAVRVNNRRLSAAIPCIAAALIANSVCHAWGIDHPPYPSIPIPWSWWLGPDLILLAAACAAVGGAFILSLYGLRLLLQRITRHTLLYPFIGGCLVLGLIIVSGSQDYLGLGVMSTDPNAVTIISSFTEDGANTWSWLWKLLFTVATVGSGFKGGEVTPLFFIGATLGNTLASFLSSPTMLLAALGMTTLFAAASKAPWACAVMTAELFSWTLFPFAVLTCHAACMLSGKHGIYAGRQPPPIANEKPTPTSPA